MAMKPPNTFTDCQGRTWTVRCTLRTLRSVKLQHNIDLDRIATDADVLTALDAYQSLASILGTMLADDLQQAGLTQEAFEAALDGPALSAGLFAVVRSIRDFLPAGPSKVVAKLHDTMLEADRQRTVLADRLIDSGSLDKLVSDAIAKAEKDLDALLSPGEPSQ